MTIVSGKIEPLKRLKEILHSHGIYRFNSIGDINAFLKQYESEKKNISTKVKHSTDDEIKDLEEALNSTIEMRDKNIFTKLLYYSKAKKLIKNHASLINNYEAVLSQRSSDSYRKLKFIKETVEGLSSVIAGAVGENAVVSELKKLSDEYYLINDFSLKFNPPIFNKRENDTIYSIQIDHLLVCQSGIFVIETKNWSSKSIEDLDLRSPVKQVKRASFALFVFLNSDNSQGLIGNHWGRKKIPIKNIIIMTNKAPKTDFQHVKVLSLDKLNGYIQYFADIFDEAETEKIFTYLKDEIL
ncbi:nuclease-related domain-containing protein [Glaciecola sp. SC05]|uniref:nuclease-related domain-containing protein n=1 Tax=Glaciecola sp. SC05 TaxID=1987355 RepID=UPI00352807D2